MAVRSDIDITHQYCGSQRVDCHLGIEDVVQDTAQTTVSLCRNEGRFKMLRECFVERVNKW